MDRGKGVDNANDDTFVMDGDNEIKNIFKQDEIVGDQNEGLADLQNLSDDDIPGHIRDLM